MKTYSLVIVLFTSTALGLRAQSDPPNEPVPPYIATKRSAHETVWQRVEWETNGVGRVVGRTNEFVELATGLNFFNETTRQYEPSREEWLAYPGGIVAQAGRHKVILATANLTLGSCVEVDILTADQVRIVCAPISLGFYDPVDGKQIVVAEVKADCKPERGASPNEILFRDCFDRVRGSLRFVYNLEGVRQHIILEQKLELPEGFSDKSRLECYTMFAPGTPVPSLKTSVLRQETNPVLRAAMVEPDFTDSEVSFGGEMAMRAGRAFSWGADETQGRSIRVGKQWTEVEGLPVLIEAVEFKQLEPLLARLALAERPKTDGFAVNEIRRLKLTVSASAKAVERASWQESGPRESARVAWVERLNGLIPSGGIAAESHGQLIQLASRPLTEPAVVVDWEYLSSQTNFTFKGDMTYFVSSSVTLGGTTTIEGGTVVKFTNVWWPKITINGPISCQTGPYRPAVFTVKDDNTVGETISGSTGNPTNQYGSGLAITSLGNTLTNVRFSYLYEAIYFNSGGSAGQLNVGNAQFVKCRYPLRAEQTMCFSGCGATIQLDNALITACDAAFRGEIGILRGRHVTVNQCNWLGDDFGNDSALYLTNSLLVAVTNWGNMPYTTNTTVYYSTDPGGIFQTVGAGSCYLVNGSTNRNAGTVVNFALSLALKKKTTYPPILITTNFTGNTTLSPQATRDTDTLDLGFHYDPIDWLCSQISPGIATVTITLTNGVAVGLYGSYGFSLKENNHFISEGRPEAMNRIVWYPSAQEQPVKLNNVAIGASGMFDVTGATSTYTGYTKPILKLRFTDLVGLGRRQTFFYPVAYYYGLNTVALTDCWLRGVNLTVSGYNWTVTGFPVPVATLQNNLVERGTVSLFNGYFNSAYQCPLAANLYNNLLWASSLTLTYNDYYATAHPSWNAKDNLFDTATNNFTGTGSYTTYVNRSHNGYYHTTNNLGGTTNLTLITLLYGAGPLGNFYPAANPVLDNAGSRDAYSAGLFHHTIKINQGMAVMETNSIVDIGFHYMALSSGLPFDTDADGIPDYADPDSDGNDGLPDWWEQKYMGHLNETPSGDFDGDCLTNLFEYQQGINPADQPTVTSAPVYQIVPTNVNVTFSVAGSPACVKYQWYKDFAAIAGATNTSLTLTSVQLTSNALYRVNILSGAGVASASNRLVVLEGPAWTIWTNHLAHTNNKAINLWTSGNPVAWDTNSLLYGKTGFTAISLSNSFKGTQGRITALTKRHGYSAGHHFQPGPYANFNNHANDRIWFLTADDQVVTMTNVIAFVRKTTEYDYALFIFSEDLTNTITPMAVMTEPSYVDLGGARWFLGSVRFRTGQLSYMSANMPPFLPGETSRPPFNEYSTFIGGDSGSANMIPTTDNSLVFIGGSSSSGPSIQMQKDMDFLCTNTTYNLNLNITNYQLNWFTNYP